MLYPIWFSSIGVLFLVKWMFWKMELDQSKSVEPRAFLIKLIQKMHLWLHPSTGFVHFHHLRSPSEGHDPGGESDGVGLRALAPHPGQPAQRGVPLLRGSPRFLQMNPWAKDAAPLLWGSLSPSAVAAQRSDFVRVDFL